MKQKNNKNKSWGFEIKILFIFTLLFVGVFLTAWKYAINLRQAISASNSATQVDSRALIEIEHMRNLVESQISDSRSFFLLGSAALLEESRKEKLSFQESLLGFERQFNLTEVPEIIKSINALEHQQQEIFDQAMKYREKHTEPKIVGQFYQSKMSSIRTHINQALDEMLRLHKEELERVKSNAKEAALGAETQVPRDMTWLTGAISFLFLGMIFLVLRLLSERKKQLAERLRLYEEALKANHARDEILVAVAHDLNEPLSMIVNTAENMANASDQTDKIQAIKTSVAVIDSHIKDIVDQAKADQKSLTLRLDQLAVDVVLDDARLLLQSLAKQRDIRLQIETVNPPTLAFFDRERVLRILSNLVGNAIKFSPKHSKVVVKVRSDQQFVYISVIDSGSGIPEKQLPMLFDDFWQARDTADQGAGVGLAVVKTIVEAHGGLVRVESQLGRGSTFTFSLPRRRPVGAQLGRPAPIVKQTPKLASQETPPLNL